MLIMGYQDGYCGTAEATRSGFSIPEDLFSSTNQVEARVQGGCFSNQHHNMQGY
jgi:hypothetical protein